MDLSKIACFVAAGMGTGRCHRAPGTCGSAAALALWCALAPTGLWAAPANQIAAAALCFLLGLVATRICLAHLRQKGKVEKDPQFIVIDEWAGMFISLIGLTEFDWLWTLTALFLFRLFDIVKPGPVRQLEKVPGEWGIMLDDAAAGFMAMAVLALMRHTF